ncbi:hypothetical protein Tco_0353634 [Tanacetum coccineum]
MMQRLLPYGLQNYLPDNIAKPIIELSSLFKQLCSATLMEDDMLKASVKVVEILCELERIYPPAFFDIMIPLPIHLALEVSEGWPIHPRKIYGTTNANNLQDPEVSTTSELFALANGPSRTPMSVNACVVDGVRYVVQSRDERRTTQNSGICAPGPDGEMSYGQLQEILEFKYLSFKVALFRVKWFDTRNNGRVKKLTFRNGMTQIIGSGEWWKNDQYILATQVKQVFYLEDPAKPNVKVVEHVNHKKFFNRGVIVVENEPDIIHLDNSSDLPPSTSGNDLDNVTFYIDLHIDGESTEVDAPPDIIDVPGEDDDISDDEDPLPHDLADSDVEDLINDDDGVEKVYSSEEED